MLISVDPGFKTSWYTIEDELLKITAQVKTDVDIVLEIIPSFFPSSEGYSKVLRPPKLAESISDPAHNGSSIGAKQSFDAGSLGIWMWFEPKLDEKQKHNPKKQKQKQPESEKFACFLTCYDAIASGETNPTKRKSNDKIGFGLKGAEKPSSWDRIVVNYPAPSDVEEVSKSQPIGTVIYASGKTRMTKGARWDWAIVKLDPKVKASVNKPPPSSSIGEDELADGDFSYYEEPQTVTEIKPGFNKGEWVAKIGRTTGVTAGMVNVFPAAFNNNKGKGSYDSEVEIMSLPEGDEFFRPGDSGSMLVNINKECLGMVFGGSDGGEVGYATPLEKIVEDVLDATGGTLTLMT